MEDHELFPPITVTIFTCRTDGILTDFSAGASIWWPNKDQWRDEVENMQISVSIPNDLVDVSNGKFIGKRILVMATRDGTGSCITPLIITMCR